MLVTRASDTDKMSAAVLAAFAGTTDNRPKPNADTATSAMRLIDVFVDICFLSFRVEPRRFPDPAWLRNAFSSDMSAPFFRVVDKREAMSGAD